MIGLAKKLSLKINLSIVSSTVSSFSIIASAFVENNGNEDKVIRILVPLVFWFGLIAEQILIWSANSVRKKLEAENKVRITHDRAGVISIPKTLEGKTTDIIMILSVMAFVVLFCFEIGEGFIQHLFVALIVLSFRLHCIFNGKNYIYKKYLAKRKVD